MKFQISRMKLGSQWWYRAKVFSTVLFSGLALLVLIAGLMMGMKSPLFVTQEIEIQVKEGIVSQEWAKAIGEEKLKKLTGIEIGVTHLFEIDLDRVRSNLSREEWIKSFELKKRFPNTFVVEIEPRVPVAITLGRGGKLHYVDQQGLVFGQVDPKIRSNLPTLSRRIFKDPEAIARSLELISQHLAIDGLDLDPAGRLRILMAYGNGVEARPLVELTFWKDRQKSDEAFVNLNKVLSYLSGRQIVAGRITLSDSKKIVVKTTPSS